MASTPHILSLLVLLGTAKLVPQPLPSYKGHIRLPIDLYTADGTRLEKGELDVELKGENGVLTLAFSLEGKLKARIMSCSASRESEETATVPIVGKIFLRSTAEPIGTEEDRQYTKTGLPQYMDLNRDWKATLRVYRSEHPESKEVYFV